MRKNYGAVEIAQLCLCNERARLPCPPNDASLDEVARTSIAVNEIDAAVFILALFETIRYGQGVFLVVLPRKLLSCCHEKLHLSRFIPHDKTCQVCP